MKIRTHVSASAHRIFFAAMLALSINCVSATETVTADPSKIPAPTISREWVATWSGVVARQIQTKEPSPATNDIAGWVTQQQKTEKMMAPLAKGAIAAYKVKVIASKLNDVPVLNIEPGNWKDDGRLLIYVHGGGFVSLSAQSTLFSSALMANRTGIKVISVDYTLAPSLRWQQITDQVIAVYKAVLDQGYRAESIGMWGDSAGGSIVAGSVLKLRDAKMPMPGALILWAPWADVTGTGDTYRTLAAFEPLLNNESLKNAAAAADQTNPYVSPVYGDYSKGFPPTLIQCGTREIFLSNCVRQYQAISAANIHAVLDIYEGMPHVFQPMGPASPETKLAMRKVSAFWSDYLQVKSDKP